MKAAFFLLVVFSLVTKSAGFVVERPDGIGIDLAVDDEIGGENEDVSDFLVDSNVDTSGNLGFIYLFIYLFLFSSWPTSSSRENKCRCNKLINQNDIWFMFTLNIEQCVSIT